MSHRTHRPDVKRQRTRHRLVQGFGQAAFYATSTTLAGVLARALLHLLRLSVSSC